MSAGTVYLLHFDQPYRHARHYVGWASNVKRRLAEHEAGRGARLLAVVRAAGIGWQLARLWPGSRARERQIKRQGGHARHCPLCGVTPRRVPVNARRVAVPEPDHRRAEARRRGHDRRPARRAHRAAPRRGHRQAIPARRPRPAARRPLGAPGRPHRPAAPLPAAVAPDRSIPMNRSALCALLILGGLVPAMLTASVTAPRPVAAFIAATCCCSRAGLPRCWRARSARCCGCAASASPRAGDGWPTRRPASPPAPT